MPPFSAAPLMSALAVTNQRFIQVQDQGTGNAEISCMRLAGEDPTSVSSFPPQFMADEYGIKNFESQHYETDGYNLGYSWEILEPYGGSVPARQQVATSLTDFPRHNDIEASKKTASGFTPRAFISPSQANGASESGANDDPNAVSSWASPTQGLSSSTAPVSRYFRHHCKECGKGFDRANRARDHAYQDRGEMPHACKGVCGRSDCRNKYSSEELLTAHILPAEERVVSCEHCWRCISKKNFSRHQKKYCPRRGLSSK